MDLLGIASADVYKLITTRFQNVRSCIECMKTFYDNAYTYNLECRKCVLRARIKSAAKDAHSLAHLETIAATLVQKTVKINLITMDGTFRLFGWFEIDTSIGDIAKKWKNSSNFNVKIENVHVYYRGERLLHVFTLADYNIVGPEDVDFGIDVPSICITVVASYRDRLTLLAAQHWRVLKLKNHLREFGVILSPKIKLCNDTRMLCDDSKMLVDYGVGNNTILNLYCVE
jgi:hypothetical protein